MRLRPHFWRRRAQLIGYSILATLLATVSGGLIILLGYTGMAMLVHRIVR